MRIYSPSIKMVNQSGEGTATSRPVFSEHDRVEGRVILDPSCSQNGRLTISFEGVFEFSTAKSHEDGSYSYNPTVAHHRHVFLHSSAVTPVTCTPETRSAIREAFGVRKRPSVTNLSGPLSRSCKFSFELPQGSRSGEAMPPTFRTETVVASTRGGQSYMEKAEVTYRISAIWEASDGSEAHAILEAPILLQPDDDFESLDGSSRKTDSWLEMPLKSERLIPFQCAVALPRSLSFSRSSSIPYFVLFTTNPKSCCLAKEIASDATVVVLLVRKVTIRSRLPRPTTPSPESPSQNEESDTSAALGTSRPRFLKKNKTAPATIHIRRTPQEEVVAPATCQLRPSEATSESYPDARTLQTQISIGFPKRPRIRTGPKIPEAQHNIPDGLYKGKLQLSEDMLPSVDWPGISVKYYLDVSVLFGQDEVRAAVPIRLF
ncbi:hypothetical protein F5I97DRAFT_2018745 [Phlebopus sp. FC_14]|nr:hypothetical protein F5I97DRAFT_2018745 [Phlebopus sp. FC_14]